AIELGMRCRDESTTERTRITGSKSVYSLIRSKLELLNHEEFWVIVLTRSNHVLDMFRLSQGGTAGTVVDSKLLFKRVVECGDVAASIVLVHNHPSGTLKPSVEDDRLTAKIKEGGKLLDLQVLDHIIVTHESYYSYNDEGRL
ncbi:RadC family protein, partial [Muribaculum sp.]|uniref:JAB domain-containing protein n=1 Tax=Muribaculum sp. TaxID=1918611 RepID=UPI00374736A4